MRNWDMSSYDKPFYIEIGTHAVAIRGTSTNDLIFFFDHDKHGKGMIMFAQDLCELMNKNCGKFFASKLKEPVRNCDAFSKSEILKMLEDRSFSKEDTIEWLFANKGENNV